MKISASVKFQSDFSEFHPEMGIQTKVDLKMGILEIVVSKMDILEIFDQKIQFWTFLISKKWI